MLESAQSLIVTAFQEAAKYIGSHSSWELLRDAVFAIFIYRQGTKMLRGLVGYGLIGSVNRIYQRTSKSIFQFILNIPMVKSKVDAELNVSIAKMQADIMKIDDDSIVDCYTLPAQGLSNDIILGELSKLENLKHSQWEKGRVSGAVYHGGEDLIKLQAQAFEKFIVANQLHPDVFPGVRKMESEVVSMVLNLFNGPEGSCGTSTSGGTESLLLACLSAKVLGYKKKGIVEPEMIVPVTVHAGFDKAAYYFGIKIHHAPLTDDYKVDLRAVKRLINSNTVLLAGSAPNYPHGIMDDIEGLGKLAQRYDIPLHVDCCLGSFIVPFLNKAGFDAPIFDFRVPGVTSISCDTHKYGFAPKGSSIVMYRNEELRACQYYINTEWTGGLYGSPTLAGSRPGALMVGCWATLLSIGEDGYLQMCKDIVGAARQLKQYVINHKHLNLVGDPLGSVVAFTSDSLNIYVLGDKMSARGWHFASLQRPAALHFAVTRPSVTAMDDMIKDLEECIAECAEAGNVASGDTAAIYGVAGSVKTTGVADRLIVGFLDALYKI